MKYLLGIALGLLLLAPIAKADGTVPDFHEIVPVDGGWLTIDAHVVDSSPEGFDLWAFCTASPPELQHVDCLSDDPINVFLPIGGSVYLAVNNALFLPTPEPSTGGLLVAGCFLCAFVALRRRMA